MAADTNDAIDIGPITARITANGRVTGHQVEVRHYGLNEHRVLSDREYDVLENKLATLLMKWEDKYKKHLEREKRSARRTAGLATAEAQTSEAEEAIAACHELLRRSLEIDDRVMWDSLKSHEQLKRRPTGTASIKYNKSTGKPLDYARAERPPKNPPALKPPQLSRLDRLIGSRRLGKEQAAQAAYDDAKERWQASHDEADRQDAEREQTLLAEQRDWDIEEAKLKKRQDNANAVVDALRSSYEKWDGTDARPVEEHAELVLNASDYPEWMNVDYDLGYNADTKTLVVEYRLPTEKSIPDVKGVTYVQSREELKYSHLSNREKDALYETILYQIALRTIHELYEADVIQAYNAIVFNGWVDTLDQATGQSSESCIMSVQAQRDEFLALNLSAVDPKACYRALKGVSAAKLAAITPVPPILRLDVGDRRFVEGKDIVDALSGESNLATMDWESFEHLVREIFEKEFVSQGGEVNVTQASRDGGVDAIAFDPDPIRGGKYVIQAKRYTRTVGVNAVRDLYGTVMHEGADRGILVTTADYGSDSVSFSKDKPLTLINGAQLLSLLEKHGHRARIDIDEARKLL